MARSERQKLKLLYLAQLLQTESDEAHPVAVSRMITYLQARGIQAERKSIYDDLAALEHFGMDLEHRPGRTGGYYLASRTFELPELKLLVDAVQSSRFLTEKKSLALIEKIEQLASVHAAQTLHRQVVVMGRVKTMNESIYYNVDEIHSAIAQNRQISFLYFDYSPAKQPVFRHGGARYQISPFALTWGDNNYYLIGYDDTAGILKHFRVDKMQAIALSAAPRQGQALFERLDLREYEGQLFDMFSGTQQTVRLRFENRLAGAVIDRFGKEISLIPQDEGYFTVSVSVAVSPRFFGWLAGFGPSVCILAPESVRQQMRDHLAAIAACYAADPV
ncbi:MAG: WYL domain-containing protein [Clostridiales bacterium]|nr:WYL domain-containing protein [Clostridiales bacterium]